jgi:ketosteroid isomerase-like protein
MQAREETGFGGISLIDRMKIMEEVAKYAWAWDSGDLEEYLDCYFEDGYLEHPKPDGSPGKFVGRDAIRDFLRGNVEARPTNSYALQHAFSSIVMTADGADVRLKAYCDTFRHEFHRQYWPHGPSFRMGTWHAWYGMRDGRWRLRGLTVKMWTDTAFVSGTAIQVRPPGAPGL